MFSCILFALEFLSVLPAQLTILIAALARNPIAVSICYFLWGKLLVSIKRCFFSCARLIAA
jgi:hypothetical protein